MSQFVGLGQEVTLRVEVTSSLAPGFGVQWYHEGAPITEGTNLTMKISPFVASDVGSYFALVTNSLGAVTSQVAVLSRILEQPKSAILQVGDSVSFSVKVEGGASFTYQWFAGDAAIEGETNTVLHIANVGVAHATTWYRVRVINAGQRLVYLTALLRVHSRQHSLVPLALEGWNRDIVCENRVRPYARPALSASVVGDRAWTEEGALGSLHGLPASRRYTSLIHPEVLFEFQPYDGPNALSWRPAVTSATIRLARPAKYRRLAILASESFIDGGTNGRVVLTFADGTQTPPLPFTISDDSIAYATNSPAPALLVGVLARLGGTWGREGGVRYDYAMFETDLDLEANGWSAKELASFTFFAPSPESPVADAFANVMAVSGEPTDGGVPPVILSDPQDVQAELDSDLTLSVMASGVGPLSYQWRFKGAALDGATNSTLVLTGLTSGNCGPYDVLVSNSLGSSPSAVARIYADRAPALFDPPQNRIVEADETVFLSAKAFGASPLNYTWLLNDQPLITNADSLLVLTNIQDRLEGNYRLLVSNAYGMATGSVIAVSLKPRPSFAEAADLPGLVWTNLSPTAWFGQSRVTHDGKAALQSASLEHQADSRLAVEIPGPSSLVFWWKVKAGPQAKVRLLLDNGEVTRATDLDWQRQVISIPEGTHLLQWNYMNLQSVPKAGLGEGVWLDEFRLLTPADLPEVLVDPLSTTTLEKGKTVLSILPAGAPPLQIQWFKDGTLIPDAQGANLTIATTLPSDAGSYYATVSNAGGVSTSALAQVTVTLLERPKFLGDWTGDANGFASAVQVLGTQVYLANGLAGLEILDTGSLPKVSRLGGFVGDGPVTGLRVAPPYAYLCEGTNGMQIVDVTDPTKPRLVGTYTSGKNIQGFPSPRDVQSVWVQGSLAFVAVGDAGMDVVDITDPSSPTWMATSSTTGYGKDVGVEGTVAYLAEQSSGYRILDVSNPAMPKRIAGPMWGTAQRLLLSNHVLFLAYAAAGTPSGKLAFLDVLDPTKAQQLGSFATLGDAVGVAVYGTRAYVAASAAGLEVLDVADFSSVRRVGIWETPEGAYDVQAGSGRAYVACGKAGLTVLDIRRAQSITIAPIPTSICPEQVLTVNAVADSGLPVTLKVMGGPASLDGNRVIPSGVGRVSIAIDQAGDSFCAPVSTEISFEVLANCASQRPRFSEYRWDSEDNLSLVVEGQPGTHYSLEASSDLRSWTPIRELDTSGTLTSIRVASETNAPVRFYRLRIP